MSKKNWNDTSDLISLDSKTVNISNNQLNPWHFILGRK